MPFFRDEEEALAQGHSSGIGAAETGVRASGSKRFGFGLGFGSLRVPTTPPSLARTYLTPNLQKEGGGTLLYPVTHF